MFENILNRAKLFALAAIVKAEIWAAEQLETAGAVIKGPEKKLQAKAFAKVEYRKFQASIPVLNATELDEGVFDMAADAAIDWAFDRAGDAVNAARAALPVPNTSAPELPAGGLE